MYRFYRHLTRHRPRHLGKQLRVRENLGTMLHFSYQSPRDDRSFFEFSVLLYDLRER